MLRYKANLKKNQEICALKQDAARKVQGMSDKYHETLDLYRKLSKNYTAVEAKLEGGKKEICALKEQAAMKGGGISGTKKKREESQSNGKAYLNFNLIQAKRAVLCEKTYDKTRVFFAKRGRWVLPLSIPENKFTEIANLVLKRLNREDKHHRYFAEPVSEEEYPDYKKRD